MNKSRLKQALKKVTDELHANLAKAIISEPNRTYRQLAEDFGVSEATVLLAASRYKLSRTPGPKPATRKKEQTNE
jgi:DNA-binding MurR/RpiR family transcriptional regulator